MNSSKLAREIALLREYRTRLIADVVTGKLDVRQAAEQLPHRSTSRRDCRSQMRLWKRVMRPELTSEELTEEEAMS